jgi:hypothetical protein
MKIKKKQLYNIGYFSAICVMIIVDIFSDNFSSTCIKYLYWYSISILLSFLLLIPSYYEIDIHGENAFKDGYGLLTGGPFTAFLIYFFIAIYFIIQIINENCVSYLLACSISNFLISILATIIFLLVILILIKFVIKYLK